MGRTRRIELCRQNKMDAASRQLLFMSFKGIGKSIRMVRAPTQNADAPAHHSDQFPAGYSLTRCSPAALVSASPAGLDYAAALAQLRGLRGKITKEDCFKNENRLETAKQSTQGWVNDHENPWVNDCENPHPGVSLRHRFTPVISVPDVSDAMPRKITSPFRFATVSATSFCFFIKKRG